MDNQELYCLIQKSIRGDLKSTFEIIIEFENVINAECFIDGVFCRECKDYVVDHLIKNIKKFKNF